MNMGEPEKACDWMVQAAAGVSSDRFLQAQLFSPEEVVEAETNDRLTVLYFLKVIHLFEQFGYYGECANYCHHISWLSSTLKKSFQFYTFECYHIGTEALLRVSFLSRAMTCMVM